MTPAQVDVRILLAMGIVVVAARSAGWAISKVGQPRVHGEIIAGILLGPSLLGVVWASGMHYAFPTEVVDGLKVIAQIGLVLFMFLIGIDLDVDHLRGHGRRAVVISHASIVVPIALGAALGVWLYPRVGGNASRTGFVLFMGAAMAITAFPVLARVLQETGLTHTRIGVLAITCAAVDDVTAWCVLAVVVAIVKSSGPGDALAIIGWSLLYVGVMLTVVRRLLQRVDVPAWAMVAFAFLSAWATEQIGIHAIFGAFMAGVVMPRTMSTRQLAKSLEMPTLTFLLPVFFVVVGLATRVDLLDRWYLWAITGLITLTAVAGKWGGAMLAARAVGEPWRDAAAIGILMNTRGLTELVILTVGLELGVIGPTIFTAMVLMALITTLMATPLLALVRPERHAEQAAPASETAPA